MINYYIQNEAEEDYPPVLDFICIIIRQKETISAADPYSIYKSILGVKFEDDTLGFLSGTVTEDFNDQIELFGTQQLKVNEFDIKKAANIHFPDEWITDFLDDSGIRNLFIREDIFWSIINNIKYAKTIESITTSEPLNDVEMERITQSINGSETFYGYSGGIRRLFVAGITGNRVLLGYERNDSKRRLIADEKSNSFISPNGNTDTLYSGFYSSGGCEIINNPYESEISGSEWLEPLDHYGLYENIRYMLNYIIG